MIPCENFLTHTDTVESFDSVAGLHQKWIILSKINSNKSLVNLGLKWVNQDLWAVHANAGIFETVCFSARFGLSSTRNRSCGLLKPEFFVTGVQGELFRKVRVQQSCVFTIVVFPVWIFSALWLAKMAFLLGVLSPPAALACAWHCLRRILRFHVDGVIFCHTGGVDGNFFLTGGHKSSVSKIPVFMWTRPECPKEDMLPSVTEPNLSLLSGPGCDCRSLSLSLSLSHRWISIFTFITLPYCKAASVAHVLTPTWLP